MVSTNRLLITCLVLRCGKCITSWLVTAVVVWAGNGYGCADWSVTLQSNQTAMKLVWGPSAVSDEGTPKFWNPHHFTLATTSLCQCLIRIMHIHRETATSPDVWPPLWTSLWFTVSPGCGHIWCWKWATSLQESSSAHYSRRCRQATWNPPGRKPVWASCSASALSPKLRCLWREHPSWST